MAAGWVIPLAFLISNGWIRSYGCDSVRAAAEYFSKSCVPGAISAEYNTGVPYDNMCDLCHGSSYRYCRRDASEDYFGHTGAFRCLVEGGGHVAFVKHTTVMENTDGKRKEFWARNAFRDEFELLCPDGEYEQGVKRVFTTLYLRKMDTNASFQVRGVKFTNISDVLWAKLKQMPSWEEGGSLTTKQKLMLLLICSCMPNNSTEAKTQTISGGYTNISLASVTSVTRTNYFLQ